jgi:hypothetical protein
MKIELTGIPGQASESDEFKKRQQNIDLLLVLAKICEPNVDVDSATKRKAGDKISSLLDKV